MHHAFVIEADAEEGIALALGHIESELGLVAHGNPDIIVMRFGLLSVEDARRVAEAASGTPFTGDKKAIVVSASRAYHEAQNALLKLFEEPPVGAYLFLTLPSLGGLLPTLRSRTQELHLHEGFTKPFMSTQAEEFLNASREKRSVIAKKLASGKGDEERRRHRDEAIEILNGVEVAAYEAMRNAKDPGAFAALLSDISRLRGYLYDRSAPVKMILEHLSLVLPKKV